MSVTQTSYLPESVERKEPTAICSKDGLAGVNPKCPTCGNPNPRRHGMQNKYCSRTCAAHGRKGTKKSKSWAEKVRATKLAKRVKVTCKRCGKDWMEKPSHSWRQYCSRTCMKAAYTKTANFPCPDCGKQMIRQPHLAKVRCHECAGKWTSAYLTGKGHNPYVFETTESRKKRLAAIGSEENRKRLSELFKDKPKIADCHKKFSARHACAVECFFRDPRNVIHYAKNICRFVHENQHLFNPEDVVQKIHGGKPSKSYVCNATQGLSRLYRGANETWKGWALVSNREGRERYDLIGRNWNETEPANDELTHSGK